MFTAKKPKPFQRPSVAVSGGPRREWAHRPAGEVRVGDTVAGWGVVRRVDFALVDSPRGPVEGLIVEAGEGPARAVPADEVVHVFGFGGL